ncbi:hypothetical protein ACVWWR_007133 [Bradyrhizobium sp. LM3.2]
MAGGQPQRDGQDHRQVRLAQHEPEHRRKQPHQHDVEWQHVEIERLEAQEQALAQRLGGVVDQTGDVELVDHLGIAEAQRQIADRGDVDHEQDDVCDVELPDPLGQPRGADEKATLKHHPGIDEGGGVAGDEDEQVGGVGKAVIAGGDPVHHIVGDMVEKDRPVRDAAKQVEPEVTALFGERGVDVQEGHATGAFGGDGQADVSEAVAPGGIPARKAGTQLSRCSIMTIPVGEPPRGPESPIQFPKGVSILCPRFPPTATVTHRNRTKRRTRGPDHP